MPLALDRCASPYTLEHIASCDRPLLPVVEVAVVLTTTAAGDRLRRLRGSGGVLRLARDTFVQTNPGWRGGAKPAWVASSAYDIVHAYQNVCAVTRRLGPVLILEDDAEMMPEADAVDFALVDAFVRRHPTRAYTLGSVGICSPQADGLHWRIGWGCGLAYCQAVVWPPALRAALLSLPGGSIAHVDGAFLSRHAPLATYCKPLVVQTFPKTENMAHWSFLPSCPRLDRLCLAAWVRALRAMDLDRDTRHWRTLYAMQCYLPLYVGIFVCMYGACLTASAQTSHPHAGSAA